MTEKIFHNSKTVYGPVPSWRFGSSLGIDPIFNISTCSFNCIYCQLGNIQKITTQIQEFVPTQRILDDLQEILNEEKKFDVITFSGSGEPTLAKNLGDISRKIRDKAPDKPQFILTNATELHQDLVIQNLLEMDKVILKLDTGNENIFSKINRPAPGVTLKSIVQGILKFKKHYRGQLEVQSMFMPINAEDLENYACLLKQIKPDLVQLNTPKRAYPLSWHRENRGNHLEIFDYETRALKTVPTAQLEEIKKNLEEKTGLAFLAIS